MAKTLLKKGVPALSRSAAYYRKHRFSVKKDATTTKTTSAAPIRSIQPTKLYPADRVVKALPSRRQKQNPTKLRATITPGTILIILAGRFKGKRVVFLKQLKSGLLLVTGPFHVNGVPLRRVSQAYVIATSTKVEIGAAAQAAATIDDSFFAKEAQDEPVSDEFFKATKAVKAVSQARKDAQSQVDAALLTALGKNAIMRSYLNTHFTLSKGQYPHLMKF